jgi:hypothetical protein
MLQLVVQKRRKRQAANEYKVDGLDLVFDPAKAAQHRTDQDRARKQAHDLPTVIV